MEAFGHEVMQLCDGANNTLVFRHDSDRILVCVKLHFELEYIILFAGW